ncbi:MAG: hypothetical protein Q4G03_09465 [Planctomycetia bacterium]|nr:hypothetical protein [Planctomycetia bacterium]
MARTSSKNSSGKSGQKDQTRRRRRSSARLRASTLGFANVKIEGGFLPHEMLTQIASRVSDLPGLRETDYNVTPGERLDERITAVWGRLKKTWELYKAERDRVNERGETVSLVTLTRKQWLLPLFKELDYGNLTARRGLLEINGSRLTLSHDLPYPVALNLVAYNQDLDSRCENARGPKLPSPHSQMQQFLNLRRDQMQELLGAKGDYLWGIITNGDKFRILRENSSLSRASYLEFDLATIMSNDQFADFYLFYLIAHSTRLAPRTEEEKYDAAVEAEGSESEEDGDASSGSLERRVDTRCWLEVWRATGIESGTRALGELQLGVKTAIEILGAGFRAYNNKLDERLATNEISIQEYYRMLLRLIYRMVFLLIAEDRGLLFTDSSSDSDLVRKARHSLYAQSYSISRLRALARRVKGSAHDDLWRQLRQTFAWLVAGYPTLDLPALGYVLYGSSDQKHKNDPMSDPHDLSHYNLRNNDLLGALRALTFTTRNVILQKVDYRNLGVEEIGGVYESLLEYFPKFEGSRFELREASGNARKTSGSYYTPPELVASLLDTTLDEVVKERLKECDAQLARECETDREKIRKRKIDTLLDLKICDPSCGSGHFLVGAARRLGMRIAQIRTDDLEPSASELRNATREVIARCVYGVDINPQAVELCKLSLWIESNCPGMAFMFLEHKIKTGNSIIGINEDIVTLVRRGIPDAAYEPLPTGDDKGACKYLKDTNRTHQTTMKVGSGGLQIPKLGEDLCKRTEEIEEDKDDTVADYERKKKGYDAITLTLSQRLLPVSNMWCGAFVQEKKDPLSEYMIIHDILLATLDNGGRNLSDHMRAYLERLSADYQFFHWNLEFPTVFESARRGFDVVVGNPPWERVKLQEREWFADRSEEVMQAPNKAERDKIIATFKHASEELESAPEEKKSLLEKHAKLYEEFHHAKRKAEATSHFLRNSGRYPLCGRGDVNIYAIFAELYLELVAPTGRIGYILPSGIATDATTATFFRSIVSIGALRNLYDFENRKKLFPKPDSRMKFALLTLAGSEVPTDSEGIECSFFNWNASESTEEGHILTLTESDFALFNPNTKTSPIFRGKEDKLLTKAIYRRAPILLKEAPEDEQPGGKKGKNEPKNPWGVSFKAMFHMSGDSHLFRRRDQLEGSYELRGNRFYRPGAQEPEFLPLYEAKMIHQFNHRFGDYSDLLKGSKSTQLPTVPTERLCDPNYVVLPRYWVRVEEVRRRMPEGLSFLLGYRNIGRGTDIRTAINGLSPVCGVGNSYTVTLLTPQYMLNCLFAGFYADSCSFIRDFVVRNKIGGINFNFYILNQNPTLPPETYLAQCAFPFTESAELIDNANTQALQAQRTRNDQTEAEAIRRAESTQKTFFDQQRLDLPQKESQAEPVATIPAGSYATWILPRVFELTYTAWDLQAFAESLGDHGAPFVWDEDRRFLLRCELDALFFGLYLGFGQWRPATEYPEPQQEKAELTALFPTPLQALDHVMKSFPIVERTERDNAHRVSLVDAELTRRGFNAENRYPSHAVIRAMYQQMSQCAASHTPFESWLAPGERTQIPRK